MGNNSNAFSLPDRPAWIGARTFTGVRAALEQTALREGVSVSTVVHRILCEATGFTLQGPRAESRKQAASGH